MQRNNILLLIVLSVVFLFGGSAAHGQSQSPVFRDYQKPERTWWAPSRLPGMGKQIYQFDLVRKANSGDADAQNDLGLRYLLGDGFEVDTAMAVDLIRKAAAQNLYAAHFNIGLLYNIGAGLPWDPFKAFLHFRYAAENGERNAQYAYGLMFTDNLVVERNWLTAYRYLKRASDNGVSRAGDVIAELLAKGYITAADTTATPPHQTRPDVPSEPERVRGESTWAPVFLDFDRDTVDLDIDIHTLLIEAMETGQYAEGDSLELAEWIDGGALPDSALARVRDASNAGNPEATVLIGKAAENGLLPGSGMLLALQEYIHAIYQDAWRAGSLLQHAMKTNDVAKLLTRKSFENDSIAMFVWAGLRRLNMDTRLGDVQALELMTMAAEGENLFAKVQLGMCYASGIWTPRLPAKADSVWRAAAQQGSFEAQTRMAAQTLFERNRNGYTRELETLEEGRRKGSLLSLVALAYAYQSGTGYRQNLTEAVQLYRAAAVRGSRTAHEALQALYDEHRPGDWETQVGAEVTPPKP